MMRKHLIICVAILTWRTDPIGFHHAEQLVMQENL
jgi:hypothetical protein